MKLYPTAPVTLLYLAKNRKDFTRASLFTMLRNTNFAQYVKRVVLLDGGSEDGTNELLHNVAMNEGFDFIQADIQVVLDCWKYVVPNDDAVVFAKIDNDVMLPPYWLEEAMSVMTSNPDIGFLGLPAHNAPEPGFVAPLREEPWPDPDNREPGRLRKPHYVSQIGGVGLFHRKVFDEGLPEGGAPIPGRMRRSGFQQFQTSRAHLGKCAWIKPALPVFLLDRDCGLHRQDCTIAPPDEGWLKAQRAKHPDDPWVWDGSLWDWFFTEDWGKPVSMGCLKYETPERGTHPEVTVDISPLLKEKP